MIPASVCACYVVSRYHTTGRCHLARPSGHWLRTVGASSASQQALALVTGGCCTICWGRSNLYCGFLEASKAPSLVDGLAEVLVLFKPPSPDRYHTTGRCHLARPSGRRPWLPVAAAHSAKVGPSFVVYFWMVYRPPRRRFWFTCVCRGLSPLSSDLLAAVRKLVCAF